MILLVFTNKMVHEAIWFGKSQHDRTKQNKLSTFINILN